MPPRTAPAPTAAFTLLDLAADPDPDPDPGTDPDGPRPDRIRVDLRPGGPGEAATTLPVDLDQEAVAALLEVALSVGGSPEVDRVTDQIAAAIEALAAPVAPGPHRPSTPSLFRPTLPSAMPQIPTRPDARRRDAVLEAMRRHHLDQRERIADALADVDDAARAVLLELVRDSQIQTAVGRSGMREGVSSPQGEVAERGWPTIPEGEGAARFRRLRTAVLDLDGLVRGLHAAEAGIRPGTVTVASARGPMEELARARDAYLEAWRRHVAEFPVLAVRGAAMLHDTTGEDPEDLLAEPNPSYTDRLSWIVRREVVDVARTAQRHGRAVVAKYLDGAQTARTRVAEEIAMLADPRPGAARGPGADVIHGTLNPLWRHPLIVWTALERLQAGPETVAYQASISAIAVAKEVKATESERAEAFDDLLDAAQTGFGVLSMFPVVGTAAVVVTGVLAATRSIAAVSSYRSEHERRMVFGVHADRLEVPDPDGYGVVLALVGNAVDVLGLIGPAGRLAGRCLRVTATARALGAGGRAGRYAGLVLVGVQLATQQRLASEIERRRDVFGAAR